MVHHSEISIVLGSRKFSDVFANFRQQFTAQKKKKKNSNEIGKTVGGRKVFGEANFKG